MGIEENKNDWLYFWENVNITYKNALIGNQRLGLFYLKIAIMLKYFLGA